MKISKFRKELIRETILMSREIRRLKKSKLPERHIDRINWLHHQIKTNYLFFY